MDAIFDKDEYGGDQNPFLSEMLVNRRNTNTQKSNFIESNKRTSDYKERTDKTPCEQVFGDCRWKKETKCKLKQMICAP